MILKQRCKQIPESVERSRSVRHMRSWLNLGLEQAGRSQQRPQPCDAGPVRRGSESRGRGGNPAWRARVWRRPGKGQCGLCSLFLFFCLFWIEHFYDSIWVFVYLSCLYLTCLILPLGFRRCGVQLYQLFRCSWLRILSPVSFLGGFWLIFLSLLPWMCRNFGRMSRCCIFYLVGC